MKTDLPANGVARKGQDARPVDHVTQPLDPLFFGNEPLEQVADFHVRARSRNRRDLILERRRSRSVIDQTQQQQGPAGRFGQPPDGRRACSGESRSAFAQRLDRVAILGGKLRRCFDRTSGPGIRAIQS